MCRVTRSADLGRLESTRDERDVKSGQGNPERQARLVREQADEFVAHGRREAIDNAEVAVVRCLMAQNGTEVRKCVYMGGGEKEQDQHPAR